jgi:hypothetical protein
MRWILVLLLSTIELWGEGRTTAQEFRTVQFELLVHPNVAVGRAIGRRPDPDDKPILDSLFTCANTYVGLPPRMRWGKIKNALPQKWLESVAADVAPTKHELEIRNDDYFPHALAIRAGDSLIDLEFKKLTGVEKINGLKLVGLNANTQFGYEEEEYRIRNAESRPIKVTNGRHPRLCYVFVINHSVGGISDSDGLVTLSDLPCDVEFPMELQYPWRERAECRLQSDSLEFDEVGRFNLVVRSESENKHVIRILSTEPAKP